MHQTGFEACVSNVLLCKNIIENISISTLNSLGGFKLPSFNKQVAETIQTKKAKTSPTLSLQI